MISLTPLLTTYASACRLELPNLSHNHILSHPLPLPLALQTPRRAERQRQTAVHLSNPCSLNLPCPPTNPKKKRSFELGRVMHCPGAFWRCFIQQHTAAWQRLELIHNMEHSDWTAWVLWAGVWLETTSSRNVSPMGWVLSETLNSRSLLTA